MHSNDWPPGIAESTSQADMGTITTDASITVFLADDNVIVREGVRAMLSRHPDIEIVGVADDYDSLIEGAQLPIGGHRRLQGDP